MLRDAPIERRAVLLGMEAYADFLVQQIPRLRREWDERAAALVASGDLPGPGGRA